MKAAIAAGTAKSKAIGQACAAGASRRAIGDVFGVSSQRICQIAIGV
jgi:hypothetical protein